MKDERPNVHNIIYIDNDGKILDKKRFEVKNKNHSFKKRKIKNFIFALCYLMVIFTLFYNASIIYAWQKDSSYTKELQKDFIKFANIKEVNIKSKDILESIKNENNNKYYFKYNNLKSIDANFEIMQNINDEIVAWIKVPGTKVDYPIFQTNDNKFYLNHSFDKSESSIGSLFLDYRVNKSLYNKNSVIYSNGKLDDMLLGSLENVLDISWYNNLSNRIIKTSTLISNNLWEVFSVYIDNEKNEIKVSFSNDSEYISYLEEIKNKSIFNFNVETSNIEKVLTLKSLNDKNSIVIHARLISNTLK